MASQRHSVTAGIVFNKLNHIVLLSEGDTWESELTNPDGGVSTVIQSPPGVDRDSVDQEKCMTVISHVIPYSFGNSAAFLLTVSMMP